MSVMTNWFGYSGRQDTRLEQALARLDRARQIDRDARAVLRSLEVERQKNHFADMIELALSIKGEDEEKD